jgi:hypothetical protein
MTDPHAWFRARLAAHLLGVLPDDEDARLREHADACDACGALLARARADRADWWAGTQHVPVVALGRWLSEPESFAAADRSAIDAHLEACEACRADLEELAGRGGRARPKPIPLAAPAASGDGARRRGRDWMAGGLVGALSAAACFAIALALWERPDVRPGDPSREPDRPPASEAPASGAPEPATTAPDAPATPAGAPTEQPRAMPPRLAPSPRIGARIPLLGVRRGAGADTTRVPATGADIVPLVPPMLDPPALRVRVDILDPARRTIATRTLSGAALIAGGVPVDLRALGGGVHELRITWSRADGTPDTLRYPFAIVGRR